MLSEWQLKKIFSGTAKRMCCLGSGSVNIANAFLVSQGTGKLGSGNRLKLMSSSRSLRETLLQWIPLHAPTARSRRPLDNAV